MKSTSFKFIPLRRFTKPFTLGRWRLQSSLALGCLIAALLSVVSARAQNVTQTLNLHAGWNAVWLEVAPVNAQISAALAGLPIDSVWTYRDRVSSTDFIQNPGEPTWNRDRWLAYVPTNRIESINNDLFTLQANRAYLINASSAFTLKLTGRPSLLFPGWTPDAYTLRGFPLDPTKLPTFLNYFKWATAHYDASLNKLEKIYRLDAGGTWALVRSSDLMQSGEAYWVYSRGASDYVAPLTPVLTTSDSLDFGTLSDRLGLRLVNRTTTTISWTLRDLNAVNPLSYSRFSPTNGTEWIPLAAQYGEAVTTKGESRVALAIRRRDMTAPNYDSVLEIRDGIGGRFYISVSAKRSFSPNVSDPVSVAKSLAGLWVGNAAVTAVNEVNSPTNTTLPTPVSTEFGMRLIIHVDTNGVCRLLKDVVQMWQDGEYTIDADGFRRLSKPGRYVLVTDEQLFPLFQGATLRDGSPVGRRLSSASYDFPTTPGANFLVLSGLPGGTNTLKGDVNLTPQLPTNPFLHKYHPDHDNLDATFTGYREEAYRVKRSLAFQFSTIPPPDVKVADFGYKIIAGSYRETISGLHRQDIQCAGNFRLTRVSEVGVLNQ